MVGDFAPNSLPVVDCIILIIRPARLCEDDFLAKTVIAAYEVSIYFLAHMRAPMICLYAPLDTKAVCIFTKNTTSEVVFTGQGQLIRFSIF